MEIQLSLLEDASLVLDSLDNIESKLEQFINAALDQSAASILSALRKTFLEEKSPDGTPWVPSKAGEDRKASGRGGGTLFDTGRLFQSIQLYTTGPNERLIGTDVPYADKLQLGIYGGVPRVIIELTSDHIELARKIFLFQLKKAFS